VRIERLEHRAGRGSGTDCLSVGITVESAAAAPPAWSKNRAARVPDVVMADSELLMSPSLCAGVRLLIVDPGCGACDYAPACQTHET